MGHVKRGLTTGGQFLIGSTEAQDIFTPEDLTGEHRMIVKLATDFVAHEVMPNQEKLESGDYALLVYLLKKAGSLGLLAHSVPEVHGGLGFDKITKALVTEAAGRFAGYSVAHANHTGIATLPITYFGTPEQKAYYLPKLASGQLLGAYCLTEPGAGSDALGAKMTATLDQKGTHYVLNGTKQFITNAGFADTFIVYAQVDGNKFTAFIVEKDFPGLKIGIEESKMGLHASSTCQVILEDCLVPVENVLGEIGRGHVIAFNVLNIGRFNLGAAALGGMKEAFNETITYTTSRRQFDKPLTAFPLTQEKLATMASRIYAFESLLYRTAQLLEDALGHQDDDTDQREIIAGLMEYAIECSICKVVGSETLDAVVDECLQLHGGYGYIKEYPIERMYRDSRINRIYEGTNEINRLLIPAMLLRKTKSGDLPLAEAIETAELELHREYRNFMGIMGRELELVATVRRLFLCLLGPILEQHSTKLEEQQELSSRLADLTLKLFAMESAVLRAVKAIEQNGSRAEESKYDLAVAFVDDEILQVEVLLRQLLAGILPAEQAENHLNLFHRQLSRFYPEGHIERKRRIATRLIEAGQYRC